MPLRSFKTIGSFLFILIAPCLLSNPCLAQRTASHHAVPAPDDVPMHALAKDFSMIPDSIQTSVYWYWYSDNISKEGVIRDLEAMKKVGINRAFIGNVFFSDVPRGKVKLFSDEWWDITHTALKTATRLGIQIGMFNGPGWSQSGGPWVKPEQSMRYLTSSEIAVKGPMALTARLPKPADAFQDVRVIAYPVPADFGADVSTLAPKLKSIPVIDSLTNVIDHNEATSISLKSGQAYTIDFATTQPYTARSLVIYPTRQTMVLRGEIQVKDDTGYQTIRHFTIDRSNDALNVGFTPYGPGAISIPATTSDNFRLVLASASYNRGIDEITWSSTPVVEDYIEKSEAKMWQDPFPYWQAYQWPRQPVANDDSHIIDPGKVLDISKYADTNGTLKWNVPAGNWVIERSGMTPTGVKNSPASPEGTGLETDKMSKKHIAAHFEAFLGEIMRRIPAEDRKTWKVTVEDSYETGGQNWSDSLIEKFRTVYGYDPLPYIPVLQGKVVGSEDQSDRFLWDLRRFVADNVAYQYVAGLRDISHQYGLTTWLENYGHWGFPGEFLQYGGQSDEVGGEFWSEGDLGNIENRAASSSAHIYGKTKVSAESFTCGGAPFARYPAMMKQRADRFFTEGINNTLLHVSIEQPYEDMLPGVNAWFGNEFNRSNTWFYDMDIFLQYIKRCNMMLQQGKYVADVAYFISEDAPKMTGTQDPALPRGYSFDYINGEVIRTRLGIKDGRLVLPDGMSYRVLVLPKLETMRPELLSKIKDLVSQGAIVLGPRPSRSPSLQNYATADKQVRDMAGELWGSIDGTTVKINKYGKGLVVDGMGLQELLDMIKVIPDVNFRGTDSVLFIHRVLDDGSVYFISNQSSRSVSINPAFRITGKGPECWDAVTGSRRDLPTYTQKDSTTTVPLQLAPMGSAFVVFRKSSDAGKTTVVRSNYPAPTHTINIRGPWTVRFDTRMRGPLLPVVFDSLKDWIQNGNDSIKYYSGTAWYSHDFNLAKGGKGESVFLDLGDVKAIAKVKVNGMEVGGAWTAPYVLDITRALRPGKNSVEIKVVNTWVNRLIGDSQLPVSERKTSTFVDPYGPKSSLESSGLLGPVSLQIFGE